MNDDLYTEEYKNGFEISALSLRPLSFQIRLCEKCKNGGDHQGATHEEVAR